MIAVALLAFSVGMLYDILNVGFFAMTEANRPFGAAVFSVLVGGCALTGFLQAVSTPSAIPFLLAGYFVGTYVAVIYKRSKTDAKKDQSNLG